MSHPLDKLREALREMSIEDLVRYTDCVEEELDRRRDALLERKDQVLADVQHFNMRLEQAREEQRNRVR